LCHVVIMALEGDDTYCHLLKCSVKEEQGLSIGRSSNKCTNSRLHGYGDADLLNAVTYPHKLLSGLHTDADMRRMIGEDAPFENASVDRSVEMLRTINKACFDNAEPITGLDSTISAKCDVGILAKDGIELRPGL